MKINRSKSIKIHGFLSDSFFFFSSQLANCANLFNHNFEMSSIVEHVRNGLNDTDTKNE